MSGRHGRPRWICFLSLAFLAAGEGRAFGAESPRPDVRERLRDASDNRRRNRHDLALKLCEGIVSDAAADDQQRIEAFDIMVDVFRRQRRSKEALSAAERMRSSFPGNKEADSRSLFAQFYCYRDAIGNHPRALARLRELVLLGPAENDLAAAHVEIANLLLRMGRYAEAHHEAGVAADLGTDERRIASAFWLAQEAAWRNGDLAGCVGALSRLLDPKYLRHRNRREQVGHHLRYAECMGRAGRWGEREAGAYLEKKVKEMKDPKLGQELALKVARRHFDDAASSGPLKDPTDRELWDDAVAAYERVFTDHAGVSDYWYDAQRGIVEAHLRNGSPGEALRAARICLDIGRHGIARNVRLVAETMREVDGDVKRANAFLDYQRWGPAGEDGKVGTKDDLKDPLSSVGYPSYPGQLASGAAGARLNAGRERAFAEARDKAGDGAHAALHRSLTYTYTGHPEKALAHYVDAFGRCSDGDFQRMAENMIVIGLRAVRGHAVGLEQVFRLVAFGPAGPDGRPDTGDDIPNQFEGPFAARVRPEAAGAGHSDEDVEALRRVRDFVINVATDRTNPERERQDAIRALQRVNEALAEPGKPGREWYVELAVVEGDDVTQEALVAAGQSDALHSVTAGDEYHLGGVHAFWRELDSRLKEEGWGLKGRARNRRRQFDRTVDAFSKRRPLAPAERHLRPGKDRRERLKRRTPEKLPKPRKPDLTAPTAPVDVRAKTVGYRRAEITWGPAVDAESGIALYEVLRDGRLVATLKEGDVPQGTVPSFLDTSLAEGSRYVYVIRAVSGIGMESPKSAALAVSTPVDREGPRVVEATAWGDPGRVIVIFSEPVERASAEDPANYHIGHGVRVTSAALSQPEGSPAAAGELAGRTVTLGTSKLSPDLTYALRIRSIRDRADAPNAVDPTRKFPFEFIDTGDGLSAVYYDEVDFKGKTVKRVDGQIEFDWSRKDPAPGIRNTNFSVRWTGRVRADTSETYTFIARTDDGVRLWIDGKQVIDHWRSRGAADSRVEVKLQAGEMYDVKMEYFQGGGGASAELHWSSKSTKRQIVPQANLYSRR